MDASAAFTHTSARAIAAADREPLGGHDERVAALAHATATIEAAQPNTLEQPGADIDTQRELLDTILAAGRPDLGLLELHASGLLAAITPEVAALEMPGRLSSNGNALHKENLAHTMLVVAQTPASVLVRWAALCHDLGKPATRRINAGVVTFQGHETLGAKLARRMLNRLGHTDIANDVATLVEVSGRAHGFEGQWTDSAVRRLAHDAGNLIDNLAELAIADTTSKHRHVRARVATQVEAFMQRHTEVAAADAEAARRPLVSGDEIMARYNLKPGRHIGEARKLLLDAQLDDSELTRDGAIALLDEWANAQLASR